MFDVSELRARGRSHAHRGDDEPPMPEERTVAAAIVRMAWAAARRPDSDVTPDTMLLLDEFQRLRERVQDIADVPCVDDWGRHPMRCFPLDRCTFCRTRELLEPTRGKG